MNFIQCLDHVDEGYISKNSENQFVIVKDKKEKTLKTADIAAISEGTFQTITEAPMNPVEKRKELYHLGKALKLFSSRIKLTFWQKIELFVCRFFGCTPAIDKINTIASKALLDGDITIDRLKQIRENAFKNDGVVEERYSNFCRFLKEMKAFGKLQDEEKDPSYKQQMFIEKSIVADEVYQKYATWIHDIGIEQFPLMFLHAELPSESAPSTYLTPEAMRALVKPGVVICENFQDYKKQLKKVKEDGTFYFVIRCQDKGGSDPHLSAVSIQKKGETLSTYIADSISIGTAHGQKFIDRLSAITTQAFPHAKISFPSSARQMDYFNCCVYVLKDLKTMQEAKKELSSSMIKTNQSLSKLKGILKADPSPKIEALVSAFTFFDPHSKKDIYTYTKFQGLKCRLEAMSKARVK